MKSFNGKPATDANIVKGVREMVVNAIKKMGKHALNYCKFP